MKLCTIKALLNDYQNTKKNQKSDLRRQNDVIIKNIGKIQTSEKPNK